MAAAPVPPPPRLSGDAPTDMAALQAWMNAAFKALQVANPDRARLDAIAAVPPISHPASSTSEQVAITLNAIIAAAQRAS